MVRVIIVDDEVLVRVGVKSAIPWEVNGFELVGEAQNGLEALELIDELNPDILICDIKMPKMNGIELLKELQKKGKKVQVILLSCHNEFEYVREAMKYGARDYIPKLSMQPQELIEVLNKLKDEINKNTKQINKDDSCIDFDIEELRNMFFKRLIKGEYSEIENICNIITNLKLAIYPENLTIICMDIDHYYEIIEAGKEGENDFIKATVTNSLNEILEAMGNCNFYAENEREYLIFANQNTHNQSTILCQNIREVLLRYTNLSVSFGISQPCLDIKDIPNCYMNAHRALKMKFFKGEGSISTVEDIPIFSDQSQYFSLDMEKSLYDALCKGATDKACYNIDVIIQSMLVGKCSIEKIIETLREALNTYARAAKFYGGSLSDFSLKYGANPFEIIEIVDTLVQLKIWFIRFTEDFIFYQQELKNRKYRSEVTSTIDYIRDNFSQDISLDFAASYVNMSPTHFSTVFRKETGTTFTDYIQNVRIERAKEMILKSDLKVYEVAEAVGYPNANYFSKLFKRITGQTPEEYKRN